MQTRPLTILTATTLAFLTGCVVVPNNNPSAARYPAGGSSSHGGGEAPPQVMLGKNREGEVIFTNNCVVYYDAGGQRTNSLSTCNGDQVRRADDAIARTRREQGM